VSKGVQQQCYQEQVVFGGSCDVNMAAHMSSL